MYSFFNQVQKKYQVLSNKYKVPSTKYKVGIRFLPKFYFRRILMHYTWYLLHGTWFMVPGTKYKGVLLLVSRFLFHKKKGYLFVAFFLFLSFFFLLLLRSLGRRLLRRFLGIHSFSHLSVGFRGSTD